MSTVEAKCINCGHPFLVNFPDRAAAPPLDAMRLAVAKHRAMYHTDGSACSHEWLRGKGTPVGPQNLRDAEAIVREYDALDAMSREGWPKDGYDHDAPSPGYIDTGPTQGGPGSDERPSPLSTTRSSPGTVT